MLADPRVLKNFWYCAGLSRDVSSRVPRATRLLGRDLVLYREDGRAGGRVRCLEDSCPHRSAPLSRGRLQRGARTRIVCPYHGWAFDGDGRVRDIPALPPASCLPTQRVARSYDIEEKDGFVWMFFGSGDVPRSERPPIPHIPEFDGAGDWRPAYGELAIDAPHPCVFDNAIDISHIHYLHSFGSPERPAVQNIVMEGRADDPYACSGSLDVHNRPVDVFWEWARTDVVHVTFTAFLPMTSAIRIRLGRGVEMITFVNTVPVDASRSRNTFCLLRNFAVSPLFDPIAERAMLNVLLEDKAMLEALVPPHRGRKELSVSTDRPQTSFRTLWRTWADLGYLISM